MSRLPMFPNNIRVYGGFDLKSQLDMIYFAGSLYFLSVDLARYITSEACDRKTLDVFSEDRAMGWFVHSHPFPLKRFNIGLHHSNQDSPAAKHPVKNVTIFQQEWNKYVSSTMSLSE